MKRLKSYLAIDFEFNRITHEKVNLVSCVAWDSSTGETHSFWLHENDAEKSRLKTLLKKHKRILGYACVAEARCFLSLDLNPLDWEWLDLFLEYRMISNHNDNLNWGNQLVDGKVKFTKKPPPKWERTEEDTAQSFKPTHSLAEATYKLTGQIRDTEEKTACRDLIISDPPFFKLEDRQKILTYNKLDVEFLPEIFKAILAEYARLENYQQDWGAYEEAALWRGRYAAHTAIMESFGYPIDEKATRNFSSQTTTILNECQRHINSLFPDIKPFKWDGKKSRYTWDQIRTRKWLTDSGFSSDNWMLTDKGQLSLSLEAFSAKFNYSHTYPEDIFGAQMVRFLKLKQALYGFSDSKTTKRKSFWDSVGPDGRVRPYMNIYGAQSGRSQPASSGFMFLKPAWMRALVVPPPGKYLGGVDYGQQEFFLGALLSGDVNMINAYLSGDPYLYIGKESGAIPPTGTKESHWFERDLFKSTTLGILFRMTKIGLSRKLTSDTGKTYTEDDAQDLIDTFEDLFPVFTEWTQNVLWDYRDTRKLETLDGWVMWGDNENDRSVTNCPIQGAGAAIMRKAVDLAADEGLKIIFTLHDAIYIQGDDNEEKDSMEILKSCMRRAFQYFFEGTEFEEAAGQIKLDEKTWGENRQEKIHIDKRALADYERFKRYFSDPGTELL